MTETAREITGEHQKNKELVFSVVTSHTGPYVLAENVRHALGRATDRREAYVDVKILSDVSALLITRKVPLPVHSGGGVS